MISAVRRAKGRQVAYGMIVLGHLLQQLKFVLKVEGIFFSLMYCHGLTAYNLQACIWRNDVSQILPKWYVWMMHCMAGEPEMQ